MPYNQSVPFRPRVDTVTDWLSDNSYDIDLAMLYFHEPDYTGHMYGPSSKQVLDKVTYMDEILGYIFQKFNETDLWNKVNLIVTSDHGMTDINPQTRSVDLSQHVDISAIDIMPDEGPIFHIQAVAGREDELFHNLTSLPHMRVFKKENIPDDWHYKNNRRILPILGVADEGWVVFKVNYMDIITLKALNTSTADEPWNFMLLLLLFSFFFQENKTIFYVTRLPRMSSYFLWKKMTSIINGVCCKFA